ncbi:K(+)-transporting ATPase subunit F [Cyanobacterium sp. IPPAS B-1200]|uniref:K(+)-transporting ATPase subunit F n=1 Tax=Cyanobacterium sp. IPPAS B-1200 TaxID=1562720 RepID=UPI003514FCD0
MMNFNTFEPQQMTTKISYRNMQETSLTIICKFFSRKLPVYLISVLLINLIFSPLVYASTNQVMSRGQSYALGLLGLVTISLFIYLFVVIFQPEKF